MTKTDIMTSRRLRTRLALLSLMAGTALAVSLPSSLMAQAIERHTPQSPQGSAVLVAPPNLVETNQDATPLGVDLAGIVILDAQGAVRQNPSPGLDLSGSGRLAQDPATRRVLDRYIGKPLSRKLIARIQADIAKRYRAQGYPFVSLSTPEQDISGGVLQIRVIAFVAGDITVEGAPDQATAAHISEAVGQTSGQPINAQALNEDLSWLNKYPFSQVQAAFTPGRTLGTSDLALHYNAIRPWQVYAGYNNSGSKSTGRDRYFIGGSIGNLLGRNSVLAYQGTLSDQNRDYDYQAHALTYSLPVGPKGRLEADLGYVQSQQSVDPFSVRFRDVEGSLGYRFALSPQGAKGLTDLRIGIEAKRETGTTRFDGVEVFASEVETYQLFAGLNHSAADPWGTSELDLSVHVSPGGVTDKNSAQAVADYSQGRMEDATYAYTRLLFERQTHLPYRMELNTLLIGQLSPEALPRSEQAGLGGMYLVRGYTLDDGAFDTAFVLRNELKLRPLNGGGLRLQPYGFVDLGTGKDNFSGARSDIASAGLGGQLSLGRHASLNLSLAHTLKAADVTDSGKWAANVNLTLGF